MGYLYEIDSYVFPEEGSTRIRITRREGKFTAKHFVSNGRRIRLDDIDSIYNMFFVQDNLTVAFVVWSREEDVKKNAKALIAKTIERVTEIREAATKLEKAVGCENFEFYGNDDILEIVCNEADK